MKTGLAISTVLVAFAAGLGVGAQQSKEKNMDQPKKPAGSGAPAVGGAPAAGGAPDAMPPEAAAWMAFGAVGPEHARLAKKVGNWNIKTQWLGDGTMPPDSSTGTSVYRLAHGGRYLVEEMQCTAMGMPFTGTGICGFNNGTQKYEYAWVDNMGTAISCNYGIVKPDGTLEWAGKMWDPVQKKMTAQRGVERWVDDDTAVSEMFNTGPDGKEYKSLVITYTRAK